MKSLLFVLTFLMTLPALAIDQTQVQSLLWAKGTSLEAQLQKGNKAILGEVTGRPKSIPVSKVVVIITEGEAILKEEIEGVETAGAAVLGNILSVRFKGQYITTHEIKGVIVSP